MTKQIKTKIEYRSKVLDTFGRRHFFLNWTEPNGKKRSQSFFANPENYGHKISQKTNQTIKLFSTGEVVADSGDYGKMLDKVIAYHIVQSDQPYCEL